MSNSISKKCPHCGAELLKWRPDIDFNWGTDIHMVCFNDECPYYKRGWEITKETMNKPASYRYRELPGSGNPSPLPVWSDKALREHIVSDEKE